MGTAGGIINALYHDPKCFTEFQSEIERKYSRSAMVLMQERVTKELFRQTQVYMLDDSAWEAYFSQSGIDNIEMSELEYAKFDRASNLHCKHKTSYTPYRDLISLVRESTPSTYPDVVEWYATLYGKHQAYYPIYSHFVSLVQEVIALASPDISGWYAALEEYLLRQKPEQPSEMEIFNYYKFNINRLQRGMKDVTNLTAKIAYYELMKVEFGRMEKLSEQGLQHRKENYDPDFVAKCDIEIQMLRETRPSHRKLVWLGKPIELGCLINQLCECGYIETEKFNNASGFNKAAMSRLLEECFELRNGEFSSVEKMFDRTSTKMSSHAV